MKILSKLLLAQLFFIIFAKGSAQESISLDTLNALSKSHVCKNMTLSDSIADIVITRALKENNSNALGYAYKNKGTNQFCAGNLPDAISIFQRAITHFTNSNNLDGLSRTLNNLGVAHKRMGDLELALNANKKQLKIALELKNDLIIASAYANIGGLFLEKAEYDSTALYSRKALDIAKKINSERLIGTQYMDLGSASFQSKDYEGALTYYLEAKPYIEKMNILENMSQLAYNMGGCYAEMENYALSIKTFNESIKQIKEANNEYLLATAYSGLAHTYHLMTDYDNAIKYNLLALEIFKNRGVKAQEANTLSNLTNNYTLNGEPQKGLQYAKKAAEVSKANGYTKKEAHAYLHISNALSALGDHKNALENLKKGHELKSEYLNQSKNEILLELRTQYDVEKKELQAQNAIQEKELAEITAAKNKNYLIFSIVAGVLFLLALGAYFLYYRNKKNALFARQRLSQVEKELTLEKRYYSSELKALKAQMNPHFLFNAMNSIQSLILKGDRGEAYDYLTKFSTLVRENLNMSEKNFVYFDEELEVINTYLELEKLRFREGFEYIIDGEETIDDIKIPTMIIQPFIENAIKHGLLHKNGGKKLNINFKEEEVLICTITDNGIGRKASEAINQNRNDKPSSFSTGAIEKRFALLREYYDFDLGFTYIDLVENGSPAGTKVILKIPYLHDE